MHKKTILWLLFFGLFLNAQSQDTINLNEIKIGSYFSPRPLLKLPASAAVIDSTILSSNATSTLLQPVNTIPGVRMEERSPGSYRLSIRGSLLRSPFGIRNVKIYIDEIPLTDAGGNTYLNLIDVSAINRIEILKGPDGSLFGANSGGVVRLFTMSENDSTVVKGSFSYGTYNSIHASAGGKLLLKKNQLSVNAALQQSDGYRRNSSLDRKYVQLNNNYHYSDKGTLKLLLFYSDLHYHTPGGLTLTQYENDPVAARPATPFIPGAEEQHAGVMNKTIFGGITNELQLSSQVKHVLSFFASHTDFENPFIINYEVRDELNGGIRTWLQIKNSEAGHFKWKINTGIEAHELQSEIKNFDNHAGAAGHIQADNELQSGQTFYFAQATCDVTKRLSAELSAGINFNQYIYKRNLPVAFNTFSKKLDPQIMPRIGVSYSILPLLTWRAIASKGYSPPTIAEILPSDNVINFSLQAEEGWNYETGFRFTDKRQIIWFDITAFTYRLQNAIVRRFNDDDTEHFINAGGTVQNGIETQLILQPIKREHGLIRSFQISNSFTYADFTFDEYINGETSYSGNDLTGVPKEVIVTSLSVTICSRFYFFISHNYTSSIPVNDSNTDYAKAYNLIQAKTGYYFIFKKSMLEVFAGADNLLNEKYSLGNDLNASGGRYYNAAPLRNFLGGISFSFS